MARRLRGRLLRHKGHEWEILKSEPSRLRDQPQTLGLQVAVDQTGLMQSPNPAGRIGQETGQALIVVR